MRDNDTLPAVLALVAGVAIMAAAVGAFLSFVGDDETAPTTSAQRTGAPGGSSQELQNCDLPDACRAPSVEFASAYNDPSVCEGFARRVCLVPLGYVPKDLVDHLVAYYRDEYAFTLHVLPAVKLQPGFHEDRPRQMEADQLEAVYAKAYPGYHADQRAVLIGLTSIDIFTAERPEWRWFFGQNGGGRAVISVYRMDPMNWGRRRDDDLRNKRVRTLMNKYIAMSYYGLPLNDNPRSVLYRLIGGLDTLDRIDERIPVPRPSVSKPTAVPDTTYAELGVEIARVYIDLLAATKALTSEKPATSDFARGLLALRDEYVPKLNALGCKTDALTDAQRRGVFNAAVKYHEAHGDHDLSWLFEAASSYGADSTVSELLSEIDQAAEFAMPNPEGAARLFKSARPP